MVDQLLLLVLAAVGWPKLAAGHQTVRLGLETVDAAAHTVLLQQATWQAEPSGLSIPPAQLIV